MQKKAGFEDYIVSGTAVRDKMLKLHQKYSNLTKLKSLNWNSSLGNFTKIQEEFIEESNKLFDISVAKFEEKIGSDHLRSQEAKDEDIQFFLDHQKGERNMYISSELDKAFECSVKNKDPYFVDLKYYQHAFLPLISRVSTRTRCRVLFI